LKLIYDKLMNKLSNVIENEEARSTHILNNQLYGVGMDEFCTAVSQRRLYGRMDSNKNIKYIKNYSGLVKTGDVNCSEILKEVFGDVRFDVVIGNPPYNNGMDLDFVNIGFEVSNKYVVMIIPAKWQVVNENQRSTSQISYGEFRNKLVSHMSNIVFYPDCRDIFEITEHSGITYFLLDKEKCNDKCIVNNRCDRNRYLRGTTRRDIKNRQSLCNIAAEIAEYIGLDGSNGLKIENMNKQGKYELWSGKFAEYGEVVVGNSGLNSRVKRQFFKDGTTPAITLNMIVRKGIDRCSYSSYRLVFGSNNETEVKSFKSYIDSKLVRFLIFFQVGVPSNILTNDTFRFVPKPPLGKFDRIYTDDEIYKAFKLPNEYIEVIEAVVNDRNN